MGLDTDHGAYVVKVGRQEAPVKQRNESFWYAFVPVVYTLLFGAAMAFAFYDYGRMRLARSIASGTHTVERHVFADGTEETRIIKIKTTPAGAGR